MKRISKKDVEDVLIQVNKRITQPYKTFKVEFKADYASQYGGWAIHYHFGQQVTYPFEQLRLSNAEAHRFLEGVLFGLMIF